MWAVVAVVLAGIMGLTQSALIETLSFGSWKIMQTRVPGTIVSLHGSEYSSLALAEMENGDLVIAGDEDLVIAGGARFEGLLLNTTKKIVSVHASFFWNTFLVHYDDETLDILYRDGSRTTFTEVKSVIRARFELMILKKNGDVMMFLIEEMIPSSNIPVLNITGPVEYIQEINDSYVFLAQQDGKGIFIDYFQNETRTIEFNVTETKHVFSRLVGEGNDIDSYNTSVALIGNNDMVHEYTIYNSTVPIRNFSVTEHTVFPDTCGGFYAVAESGSVLSWPESIFSTKSENVTEIVHDYGCGYAVQVFENGSIEVWYNNSVSERHDGVKQVAASSFGVAALDEAGTVTFLSNPTLTPPFAMQSISDVAAVSSVYYGFALEFEDNSSAFLSEDYRRDLPPTTEHLTFFRSHYLCVIEQSDPEGLELGAIIGIILGAVFLVLGSVAIYSRRSKSEGQMEPVSL